MVIDLKEQLKKAFYHKPFIWPILEFFQGVKYISDYFFYYLNPLKPKSGSIREINLEFASSCNLRCQFCALDHQKPHVFIKEDLLRKTLDSIIHDPTFSKIKILNLYNGGETLLHPQRIDMLKVVKEYKELAKEQGKHFPEVWMVTNAMLLRENLATQIVELDVIDHIRFSVDGGSPMKYEEMRRQAKWPVFYKNVKFFAEYNRSKGHKTKMSSISLIEAQNPLTTDWMDPEFAEILRLMDHSELRRIHNWAGEIDNVAVRNKPWKIGCGMLMSQLVVLPSGDVTVCCNDLNSRAVVGNLNQNTLQSIYASDKRRNMLKLMLLNKKSEIELCRDCETF